MANVVSFTGERLVPGISNADLAAHLHSMADEVLRGCFGDCQLVSVITLDDKGWVRHANRSTRHFISTEYIGILEVAKHQVLNDIHPEYLDEPEDGSDTPVA